MTTAIENMGSAASTDKLLGEVRQQSNAVVDRNDDTKEIGSGVVGLPSIGGTVIMNWAEDEREKNEMRRGADGKEFGNALHQGEENELEQIHGVLVLVRRGALSSVRRAAVRR